MPNTPKSMHPTTTREGPSLVQPQVNLFQTRNRVVLIGSDFSFSLDMETFGILTDYSNSQYLLKLCLGRRKKSTTTISYGLLLHSTYNICRDKVKIV